MGSTGNPQALIFTYRSVLDATSDEPRVERQLPSLPRLDLEADLAGGGLPFLKFAREAAASSQRSRKIPSIPLADMTVRRERHTNCCREP